MMYWSLANATTYTQCGSTTTINYPYLFQHTAQNPEPKKKEGRPMRSLYHVFVVDPEEESILGEKIVIAENEQSATLRATTLLGLKLEKQLSEYDIVVECVSEETIRPHVDTQKVKIVGEVKE
jgi:hypothetical protein